MKKGITLLVLFLCMLLVVSANTGNSSKMENPQNSESVCSSVPTTPGSYLGVASWTSVGDDYDITCATDPLSKCYDYTVVNGKHTVTIYIPGTNPCIIEVRGAGEIIEENDRFVLHRYQNI